MTEPRPTSKHQIVQPDSVRDYELRGGLYVPKGLHDHTGYYAIDYSGLYLNALWGNVWGPNSLAFAGESETPAVTHEHTDTELVGWRCWLVQTEDSPPSLWSLHRAVEWDGPTLRADRLPSPENPSGIYALQERSDLDRMLAPFDPYATVYGQVALSGTVVEGSQGYRGEVAVIRSLYVRRGTVHLNALELADALSTRYCVTAELDIDPRPRPNDEEDDD